MGLKYVHLKLYTKFLCLRDDGYLIFNLKGGRKVEEEKRKTEKMDCWGKSIFYGRGNKIVRTCNLH